MDSLIGSTLGKYRIDERIGRGATATVYRAHHPTLDLPVAIKLLHSYLAEDRNFRERFQREATTAAQLRHPNIIQIYDFEAEDGVYYYIVMEYVDGGTLDTQLQALAGKHGIMPLKEAIRIASDVASALSYAHARGMVHRDIKPPNVLIDRTGRVILTDFGIARMLGGPRYTATGAIAGTPNYMPPEQGLGRSSDARGDIYSLGAMFFQMVTGRLPYEGETGASVMLRHINDPIPIASDLNPSLSPGIDTIIFQAMAKDPGDRYQNVDAFIADLNRLQESETLVEAVPNEAPGPTPVVFHSQASTIGFSALPRTIRLVPYTLAPGQTIVDPTTLPAACDAHWDRAVEHFSKGYITDWLRDGVARLREAFQHGPADELDVIRARAEIIVRQIQSGDEFTRNAGLEEFLETLGAPPPMMRVEPDRLELGTLGIGETGSPVTLTITNRGRGFLFCRAISHLPWLKVKTEWLGCLAGQSVSLTLEPDLSGLPAGRIESPEAVEIRSTGQNQFLPASVEILPSALHVDASVLDFGSVGQGETVQRVFQVNNDGQGILMGRVLCRVPWLAASPAQFNVPAGASTEIAVSADTQPLPPGEVDHAWALVVESNGGNAVLGMNMNVLPPRLHVEPLHVDLGNVDLAEPHARRQIDLTVSNTGAGVLYGAVMLEANWLTIEPASFRCRTDETQTLRLSTGSLKTGQYRQVVRVQSSAGVAEVPVKLRAHFSLEPDMVYVQAGPFLRGSDDHDKLAQPAEQPQRTVELSEYWIGRCPVSNAEYAAFVQATGRRSPEHWLGGRPPDDKENHPVVNVSWWDAAAYCRWLAEITGKPYRLPTEAQWEKAARGADGRIYPWGNRWDSRKCNAQEGGVGETTPVGAYGPAGDSPYGCADMAGNVMEWVTDWYRADYYARSNVLKDPTGPASGAVAVLRGGSYASRYWNARCASRVGGNRTATAPEVGFRCAVWLPSKPEDTPRQEE
ncbi:MAG TPA: bifunctional serine/threonine-protein kinase/formylglycine-generating enzyme family protein [Anaerolineae bacterium]